MTCIECGSENVVVTYDDDTRGEEGPYEVECLDCRASLFVPEETTARTRIAAFRQIVREHAAKRVEGYLVDAFTAGMLVTIYDALSPASREKFGQPSLARLVAFGWSHVRAA